MNAKRPVTSTTTTTTTATGGASAEGPSDAQRMVAAVSAFGVQEFQVFVRGLSTHCIQGCKPTDSVASFLLRVAEQTSLNQSTNEMHLSIAGKPLAAKNASGVELTLGDYNVQRDANFELSLKVRGGSIYYICH